MTQKRQLIIDGYGTGLRWVLSKLSLSAPALKTKYVEVPGRSGAYDYSTALTDGVPCYGQRTLKATLESSEGNRAQRETWIGTLINLFDGKRLPIILPDDTLRYVEGRVSITRSYNDTAHCAVELTATCDPWRYSVHESGITATATEDVKTVFVPNEGRMPVLPRLTVSGSVTVETETGETWHMSTGSYDRAGLVIPSGGASISCSGAGTLTLRYREGCL